MNTNRLRRLGSVAATVLAGAGALTLALGASPATARASGAHMAYVAEGNQNQVAVIDTAGNTVATYIAVGSHPDAVAASPSGDRVYVANLQSENVSVIDTSSNSVVATYDVATSPDGWRSAPTGRGST